MIPLPSNYDDFDPHFSSGWDKVSYPVETTPRVYLDFAIEDFESSSEEKQSRTLVNALSNAKRALHLQVETIAKSLGFVQQKRGFPNFHAYLGFCEKCGVVTPRILKKLNTVRNAVEHEYYIPTESETEDFIDVVELFLAATDKFIYQFPVDLEWLPGKVDESIKFDIRYVKLKPNSGTLTLISYEKGKDESLELDPSMDEYFVWLKVLCDGVHKGSFNHRS
ncbi:hypothetical protein NI374_06680 [Vibrio parahaemolyticus]|nr:hypothetical protein NI374_06680 [Vibrio parahaemolyticus]